MSKFGLISYILCVVLLIFSSVEHNSGGWQFQLPIDQMILPALILLALASSIIYGVGRISGTTAKGKLAKRILTIISWAFYAIIFCYFLLSLITPPMVSGSSSTDPGNYNDPTRN